MLSTFCEFSKKDTLCKCVDAKQICVLLPFPSDFFCVSLFLRDKNYVQLILIFKKHIYMARQVVTKDRREIGKIIFIKTFINVAGAAYIFCVTF